MTQEETEKALINRYECRMFRERSTIHAVMTVLLHVHTLSDAQIVSQTRTIFKLGHETDNI